MHAHILTNLFAALAMLLATWPAICEARGPVAVRGYFKSNGTYVAPHYRSAPDGNFSNNWSTSGNVNPYTGKEGTRATPPVQRYGAPPTTVVTTPTPGYTPPTLPITGRSIAPATIYVRRQETGSMTRQDPLLGIVSVVQLALVERGFRSAPPNDELDFETRRAIELFQKSQGIPAHGRMDRLTLATLGISAP